jgi:DNA-binding transcriptional ArsR family regulator
MDLAKLQVSAKSASALLKALGNEHRLMILCRLVDQERSVGELVRAVGLSQSALSQHLARLRRDGIVRTRREAQTIWYTIASPEAREVLATLYELYCGTPPAREESSAKTGDGSVRAEVCA